MSDGRRGGTYVLEAAAAFRDAAALTRNQSERTLLLRRAGAASP